MCLNKPSIPQKGNREQNSLFYDHCKISQGPKMLQCCNQSLCTSPDWTLNCVLQSHNVKIKLTLCFDTFTIQKEVQAVGTSSILKCSLIVLKDYRVFKAEIAKELLSLMALPLDRVFNHRTGGQYRGNFKKKL